MTDQVTEEVTTPDSVQVEPNTKPAKRGRPRRYNYPSKLVCTVTGKVVLTNPTQFEKQLKASGVTQEEYIKTYICRTARSKIKNGTLVVAEDGTVTAGEPRIKKTKRGRPKNGNWSDPEVVEAVLDRAFPAETKLVEWKALPDDDEYDDGNSHENNIPEAC